MAVFVGVPCSSLQNSRLCTLSKIFGRCLHQGKDCLSDESIFGPLARVQTEPYLHRDAPGNASSSMQVRAHPQAHVVPGCIDTHGNTCRNMLAHGLAHVSGVHGCMWVLEHTAHYQVARRFHGHPHPCTHDMA